MWCILHVVSLLEIKIAPESLWIISQHLITYPLYSVEPVLNRNYIKRNLYVWLMGIIVSDWIKRPIFHAYIEQECIPVGCVLPSAVAIGGGVSTGHPPGADPPGSRHPPWRRHPHPREQTPPRGQTHACKHITLPQTSFAGGNEWFPVFRGNFINVIQYMFCCAIYSLALLFFSRQWWRYGRKVNWSSFYSIPRPE